MITEFRDGTINEDRQPDESDRQRLYQVAQDLKLEAVDFVIPPCWEDFYTVLAWAGEQSKLDAETVQRIVSKHLPGEGYEGEQLKHTPKIQSPPTEVIDAEIMPDLPAVLTPEECVAQAGMVAKPAFSITDEASASWFLDVVRRLQHRIDDVAKLAHASISADLKAIDGLMAWKQQELKGYCLQRLAEDKGRKKKYIDFLPARVFFRKTGGAKMHDRAMVEAYLINTVPEDAMKQLDAALDCVNEWLEGSGGSIDVKVKLDHPVLKALAINGAAVPGYGKTEPDDWGSMSIGADKAWTANAAKERISAAFKHGLRLSDEGEQE